MLRKHHIVFCLATCCMMACTSPALREAQETVAQADSLWMAGKAYTDSAGLAQAYKTLKHGQYLHADEYAHACYHYGKLLRAKEDPAAAMECFINATHARTSDYPILGRVYNNIGDICHIAGEYALSYEMFERSANEFLKDGDTLSYYYCLNDMAFELAVQGEERALNLIVDIAQSCKDDDVLAKTHETQAELYKQIQQYDSAIYYADLLLRAKPSEHTGLVIKAQVYDKLKMNDSALSYAHKLIELHPSPVEYYNVLYILTHADSSLSENEILELTSLRDDIHTYELDVHKTEHAKAIQVLYHTEQRYSNQRRVYIFVFIFIVLLIIAGTWYLMYVNRKHKLIVNETAKNEEQNRILSKLTQEREDDFRKQAEQLEKKCCSLRSVETVKNQLSWNDYKKMSAIVDANFAFIASKLRSIYNLKENEIRLCILVLIDGFTSKQLAGLLYYAESGIRNFKSNTAKKLGTNGPNMHDFLINLVLK